MLTVTTILSSTLLVLSWIVRHAAADNVPTVYQATYTNMSMGKSSILNYYISNNKDFTKVTRAIISIHGLYRDPWNYFNAVNYAVNEAGNVGVDPASLVLMTPFFPNGNDKATATGANARNIFNSTNQLCWSSDLWAQGAPATSSRKTVDQTFTSHQAIDALIAYFNNKAIFPALTELVVFGHSAGAQLVQSYTVVGNPVTAPLKTRFLIGAPGAYVWLNNERPLDTSACSDYNTYHWGLDGFTYKPVTPTFPNAAFEHLDIIYNYGSSDNDPNFTPADFGCETEAQGDSHASRMQNYWSLLLNMYGQGIRTYQRLSVTPGGSHSSYADQYIQWLTLFSPISTTGYPIITSNATAIGCFADSASSRALPGPSFTSNTMDVDTCVSYCAIEGYAYAGVEYGRECYCGNTVPTVSIQPTTIGTDAPACDITCYNNFNEYCGGADAINVFATNSTASFNATALGCFKDYYPGSRALAKASTTSSQMTSGYCGQFCTSQGFTVWGTEYGDECYCGSSTSQLVSIASNSCSKQCAGYSSEICGGSNALSVYTSGNNPVLPVSSSSVSQSSSTISSSISQSSSTTSSSASQSSSTLSSSSLSAIPETSSSTLATFQVIGAPISSPTSTSPIGPASPPYGNSTMLTSTVKPTSTSISSSSTATPVCLSDGYPTARTLSVTSFTSDSMTNELCQSHCFSLNFLYAGTEYGRECYCAQTISVSSITGMPSTSCTYPCAGASGEMCGGSNAIMVATNPVVPGVSYSDLGCYSDSYPAARYLSGPNYSDSSAMTPEACKNFCFSQAMAYAGVEYASQCFCGSSLSLSSVALAASACSYPCSGNSAELCGGSNALEVYYNSAL